MARLSALREVLATRDFRKLFAVRLVGQFSDGLLQAALATFVLFSPERQPDAFKVAAAFAILLLPYSFIGPFAGVFLDRWRRQRVLVRANLIKGLATLPIVFLVVAGNDGLWLGVCVLTVLGIGRFVLAGLSASLPHVVQGRDLITANALTPTSGTVAAAVGAGAGVALRTAVGGGDHGSELILILAAAGFVVAGLLASRIAVGKLGPSGEKPADTIAGVLRGMADGVRGLKHEPIAGRAIAVAGAHRIVFGALTVGALLLVRNTFNNADGADAALNEFAVITGFAATGALLAALMTPAATRKLGSVTWSCLVLVQGGVIGIPLVFAGAMVPSFPALLLGAASVGFTGQGVKVCADTLVQRHVPDDHLGRIFALFDMVLNVCLVAGISLMAFGSPPSGQAPVLIASLSAVLLGTALWYRWTSSRRLTPQTN